jgi:hypothetical protein
MRVSSLTKGELRAKELWVSRIRSEFDSASPRSCGEQVSIEFAMRMERSLPTYVCRESRSELLELSEVRANVDVAVLWISILVQKHAQ